MFDIYFEITDGRRWYKQVITGIGKAVMGVFFLSIAIIVIGTAVLLYKDTQMNGIWAGALKEFLILIVVCLFAVAAAIFYDWASDN